MSGPNAPYYVNNKVDDIDFMEASDLEAIETGFEDVDTDKANKAVPTTENSIALLSETGDLVDSEVLPPADNGVLGQVLTSGGPSAAPAWADPSAGGVTELVATGVISAAGVAVALRSDGTVEAVSGAQEQGYGDSVTLLSSSLSSFFAACYDSTGNKIVIAYRDTGNSNYGTARVGEVSGSNITFGAPVVFNSDAVADLSIAYDQAQDKVAITFEDTNNSGYPTCIVGTVSGNSISFGTEVVVQSAGSVAGTHTIYDAVNSKIIVAVKRTSSALILTGTISGTSISFGANNNLASGFGSIVFSGNTPYVFQAQTSSTSLRCRSYTISGETITLGDFYDENVGFTVTQINAVYYNDSDKFFIVYSGSGQSTFGIVATISAGVVSYGTPVELIAEYTTNYQLAYNQSDNLIYLTLRQGASPFYSKHLVIQVAADVISVVSTDTVISESSYPLAVAFDANAGVPALFFGQTTTGNSVAVVYGQVVSSNADDFYGFAQGSAVDTGDVNVAIPYQVDTNQTGLTPKTNYWIEFDGSLSTTDTGYAKAGYAINATTLQVGVHDADYP